MLEGLEVLRATQRRAVLAKALLKAREPCDDVVGLTSVLLRYNKQLTIRCSALSSQSLLSTIPTKRTAVVLRNREPTFRSGA